MSANRDTESGPPPAADATLEWEAVAAHGSVCALLTPAIKAALGPLAGGQTLEARLRGELGDLGDARADIAAWSRLTGHHLLAVYEDSPQTMRVYLRKKRSAM